MPSAKQGDGIISCDGNVHVTPNKYDAGFASSHSSSAGLVADYSAVQQQELST